jgi:hypothetical protein
MYRRERQSWLIKYSKFAQKSGVRSTSSLGGFVMRCHTSLTGVIPLLVLVEYALLRFVGGCYVHTGCLRSIAAAHFSVGGSVSDLTTVMNNIIVLLLTPKRCSIGPYVHASGEPLGC